MNYGILASAPIGSCLPLVCANAAGYFNGDVYTTSAYITSDINLKDQIQPLENSLSVITALSPKKYIFKNQQFPYLNLPTGIQDGLIAQQVQQVLPGLVKGFQLPYSEELNSNMDTTGIANKYLSINYIGLIPYLIGAIKEQQANMDSLAQKMAALQDQLSNCCNASTQRLSKNAIDVELTNSIILNQNDPNPFSQETKIEYNVPGSVLDAKIIFFDNQGHIIQTVKINERGSGQLNVYASNLTSGLYSYSLIADGKVIGTKKMVVNK